MHLQKCTEMKTELHVDVEYHCLSLFNELFRIKKRIASCIVNLLASNIETNAFLISACWSQRRMVTDKYVRHRRNGVNSLQLEHPGRQPDSRATLNKSLQFSENWCPHQETKTLPPSGFQRAPRR